MTDQKSNRATRESVEAWFTERQQSNRRRRENPVRPEQVIERIEARANDRARAGRVRATIPAVLGATFLAAAAVICVATTSASQSFAAEQLITQQEIAAAEGERNALAKSTGTDPASGYADQVASVRDVATEVASLQQQYARLLFAGNDEEAGDAGPQLAYEASLEHQSALAPYFAPETYTADREDALGETRIDPRFPWFVAFADDDVTVLNPDTTSWTLAAINPAADSGTYVATWVNRNPTTGDLYAWAQGTYDMDRRLFVDLVVGKTTLGDHSATEPQKARK
ncbi:hypothetical protein OVA26_16280 [Microbacterium sp. SL62]|uniref:hypothetical protein n=1 Tax=Microbacterium sp. SL62 TaxID=2995139 RepID=UPI0022746995|nr:hypothetical protein [Microbacterium sp. SL62]MCY1718494.1 hypothetical protein [Microbacterium sp. SL62]